jgi:hypothetical protein
VPAWRPLAHQHALGGDRVEQVGVGGRVRHVHAAGEHRDRHPVGAERAPVRRGIHAERAAGYHRPAAGGDGGGELGGDVGAVGGRRPGADDRERAQAAEAQVGTAAQPQRVRLVVPQVRKLPGPFRVARADQPDPRLAEGEQLLWPRQVRQPHSPSLHVGLLALLARAERAARLDGVQGPGRAVLAEQPGEPAVGRLDEVGERRPRVFFFGQSAGHCATPSHSPIARLTWSAPGWSWPARSASDQATRTILSVPLAET